MTKIVMVVAFILEGWRKQAASPNAFPAHSPPSHHFFRTKMAKDNPKHHCDASKVKILSSIEHIRLRTGQFSPLRDTPSRCLLTAQMRVYVPAMNESLTEYLVKQSSKLPVQQLREVIDFTEFLASKLPPSAGGNGAARALKQFVGGVSHGSMAAGIDNELYGSSVR